MSYKILLCVLVFFSCGTKIPSENKLLDYKEAKLIANLLNSPYTVYYSNTNYEDYIKIDKSFNNMKIEMTEDYRPVVTVHELLFEMEEFVEIPNLTKLYFDLKYNINVSNPVHSNYDMTTKILYFKRPEDRAWREINYNDISSILDTPFPVKFRFEMKLLSGIAGIRGQEVNTANVEIYRFGIFGEF